MLKGKITPTKSVGDLGVKKGAMSKIKTPVVLTPNLDKKDGLSEELSIEVALRQEISEELNNRLKNLQSHYENKTKDFLINQTRTKNSIVNQCLNTRLNSLKKEYSTLKDDVNSHEFQIDEFDIDLSQKESEIADLEARLSSLKEKFSILNGKERIECLKQAKDIETASREAKIFQINENKPQETLGTNELFRAPYRVKITPQLTLKVQQKRN